MIPHRAILALAVLFTLAPFAAAASRLAPGERAVIIAARHLLTSIGTPELDAAIRDGSMRGDAYWERVFSAAGAADLYSGFSDALRRAMNDVPFVNGRPAEPDVFARAVLRGIGPMPMTPLNEAPEAERRAVLAFAREELAAFAKVAYETPGRARPQASVAAARARAVFRSPAIAEAFGRLGDLLGGSDESRIELADTKDRLNEYLHPFGLHLVLDGADLAAGRANLASYVILSRHAFNILGKPFIVYEARPSVESHTTSALGHAEIEPGYMFIFANHVDRETEAGLAFAAGQPLAMLERGPGGALALSTGTIQAVETAVRERISGGTGGSADRYRELLINTIGRHEGFHMYIEPGIAHAVRRGKISRGMSGSWHENGAYLYQLEVSDPRFVHMDLLMLLIVAMSGSADFPDNTAGARAAMMDLQAYLKDIRFWDGARHAPIDAGVGPLFRLPPEEIQKAASQARWAFEVTVRN